jgi:hypothetical protein
VLFSLAAARCTGIVSAFWVVTQLFAVVVEQLFAMVVEQLFTAVVDAVLIVVAGLSRQGTAGTNGG